MSDEKKEPELKGSLPRKLDPKTLSPMEIEALRKQGLWNEEESTIDQKAFKPRDELKEQLEKIPSHLPKPTMLVDPEKEKEIAEKIEDIRDSSDQELKDMKLNEPLEPPAPDSDEPEVIVPESEEELRDFSGLTDLDAASAIAKSEGPVPCPHCGWDHRLKFREPSITEEDKLSFLRHLLGTGRFYRDYKLMDGSIRVRLRSRTDAESVAVWTQGKRDLRTTEDGGAGRVVNEIELQTQVIRYQLAASLAAVDNDGEVIEYNPILDNCPKTGKKKEDWVYDYSEKLFGGERPTALYNIICAKFMEFERLYQWLTAKAHDPDFWQPVDGDR